MKLLESSSDRDVLISHFLIVQIHSSYLQSQSSDNVPFTMPAIKYEDFLSNKIANVQRMFKFCGLDLKLVPEAIHAFHKDS